jgi:hypothetical protein
MAINHGHDLLNLFLLTDILHPEIVNCPLVSLPKDSSVCVKEVSSGDEYNCPDVSVSPKV